MQEINSLKELKDSIRKLESEQKEQARLLKLQFSRTTESLSPLNLVKVAFREILTSPVVLMIGIEKIKSFVHQLIDRFMTNRKTAPEEE
jgi:hypothetical protein